MVTKLELELLQEYISNIPILRGKITLSERESSSTSEVMTGKGFLVSFQEGNSSKGNFAYIYIYIYTFHVPPISVVQPDDKNMLSHNQLPLFKPPS